MNAGHASTCECFRFSTRRTWTRRFHENKTGISISRNFLLNKTLMLQSITLLMLHLQCAHSLPITGTSLAHLEKRLDLFGIVVHFFGAAAPVPVRNFVHIDEAADVTAFNSRRSRTLTPAVSRAEPQAANVVIEPASVPHVIVESRPSVPHVPETTSGNGNWMDEAKKRPGLVIGGTVVTGVAATSIGLMANERSQQNNQGNLSDPNVSPARVAAVEPQAPAPAQVQPLNPSPVPITRPSSPSTNPFAIANANRINAI